jgi:hypothetical protein
VVRVGTDWLKTIAGVASSLACELQISLEPRFLVECRAGDNRHRFAGTSLASTLLNVKAWHALQDGLPDLVEWCREEHPPDRMVGSHEDPGRRGLLR